MWHHPSTKLNIDKLASFGNKIIPVEKGDLASGLHGDGRMAEPENIVKYLETNFFLTGQLKGKKAIVTAGPTYEPLDPVRFIGNHSSGKMGLAIAKELYNRGADVTLIMGPTQLQFSGNGVNLVNVSTADEMYHACMDKFDQADITIMAAAVADYMPINKADEKIKKKENSLSIELTKTKDILKSYGFFEGKK